MHRYYTYPKIFFCICFTFIFIFLVNTQDIQAQTSAELQKNIADRTLELQKLEKEAEAIRRELAKVGSEKTSLTKELNLINAERKSLENTIKKTRYQILEITQNINGAAEKVGLQNKKLSEQSQTLAQILRKVYIEGNSSDIEKFFSFKNLSEIFKNKERYYQLQKPITNYTDQVKKERELLQQEQKNLESHQALLLEQNEKLADQQSIILDQESKKQNVLSQAKNKESEYQKNLNKTLMMIKELDAEVRKYESELKFIVDKKSLPNKGSAVLAWPLETVLITQRFGKTVSSERLYVSGSHSGVDFRAAVGTPVYAVADGVVKGVGDTDEDCPKASFGKWVFIEHPNGLSTTYGHLSKIKATEGQKVKQGTLIGYSGNTGHSTAPHLHLTVYATKGVNGEAGARITSRPSSACVGKNYRMPLAPTSAYLDPLVYLPKTDASYFK